MRKPILMLVMIALLSVGVAQCSFTPKYSIDVIDGSNNTFIKDFEKYDTKLVSRSSIFLDSGKTSCPFWPLRFSSPPELFNFTSLYPAIFLQNNVGLAPIIVDAVKVIPASKILSDIAKDVPIKYDKITIKGDLDLNGSVIKFPLNITNSEILGSVNFSDVVFQKSANFSGVLFNADSTFEHAWFKGEISAQGAKFGKDARFLDAQFSRFANFMDAQFSSNADFTNAKFDKDARFLDAQFSRFANFTDAQFSGNADFTGAKFNGDVLADSWFKFIYVYKFYNIVLCIFAIIMLVLIILIYKYRKSKNKVSITESKSYEIMNQVEELRLATTGDEMASFNRVTRHYKIPRPEYPEERNR